MIMGRMLFPIAFFAASVASAAGCSSDVSGGGGSATGGTTGGAMTASGGTGGRGDAGAIGGSAGSGDTGGAGHAGVAGKGSVGGSSTAGTRGDGADAGMSGENAGGVTSGGEGGEAGAGELPWTCSSNGTACALSSDCAQVSITGHCVTRDDADGAACVYDTRRDTGMTQMCEQRTFTRCRNASDCPTGLGCGFYGSNWCGTVAPAICAQVTGGGSCSVDDDCTLTRQNVCVICGDGIVASPSCNDVRCRAEECDDGNIVSGDGCSSDCHFERECFDDGGGPTGEPCASVDDCLATFPECESMACTCEAR
jgi:cysteine-rich repeat protein